MSIINWKDFKSFFVGNLNAYGLQNSNGSWTAVREKITKNVIEKHLNQDITIGSYTIYRKNNRVCCKWICIDIDLHPFKLENGTIISNSQQIKTLKFPIRLYKNRKSKNKKSYFFTAQELEEYYWNKSGLIVYEKASPKNPEKKKIKEIYIDNLFLKFIEKYKIEADDRDKLKNLVNEIKSYLKKFYNIPHQAICSEESGRGYHIWINLQELTTLKRAYDFRESIFEKVLLRFGVELDEINPKQADIDDIHKCPHCGRKNRISVYNRDKSYTCRYCNTPFEIKPNTIEFGLGNFVKLPYSINHNTKTECIILDKKFDLATQKAFTINELVKRVRKEKQKKRHIDPTKSEVDLEKWTPLDKKNIFFYNKLRHCLKKIVNGRQATGTYGHDIRIALANDLFRLKAPVSTRINAFARQKDFDLAKTTYQVEDLEMRCRKSNKFFTSNCKTLAKWGYCYPECPYRYKSQEVSEDDIIKLLMNDVATIKGITGGWTEARELLGEKITNGVDTKEYVIKTTRSGTTTNVILETINNNKKLFMIAPTIRICDITVNDALDLTDKEVNLFRFGSNKDLCIRLAEKVEETPSLNEFPFLLKEDCRGCMYNTHVPCAKHEVYDEKCEDCQKIHKNREKCNWRIAIEDIEDFDIIYITIAKMYALTQTTDPEGLYILKSIYDNIDVIFLDEISNVLDVGSASIVFKEKADSIYRKIAGERNFVSRFSIEYEDLYEFMDNRLSKQQKQIWYGLYDFVKQINKIHNTWHKLEKTDEFYKINSPLIRILRDIDTHYKEKNKKGSGDSDWLGIYKQLIEYTEETDYTPKAIIDILILAKYKQVYIQYTAPLRYEFRMEVIPAKPVKEFIDFLNTVSEQRQFFTTDATEPPIDVHRMFPNLKELIIDDPMGTAKIQKVYSDLSSVNVSKMSTLRYYLKDIVKFIKNFSNSNTMIITQNIITSMILRKVLDKKKDYKHLTYFRSPLTIGTPSSCRNVITIGNPYPPKNSHRWLADLFLKEKLVDENEFDIESLTQHLEYYNAKSNFFQAISRGKDPEAKVKSTVYCYGLNYYQIKQLLKFPISIPNIPYINKNYVYFAKSLQTPHIKIGTSTDPERRMFKLKIEHEEDFELLGCIEGSYKKERQIHKLFKDIREGKNEFFTETPKLMEFIDKNAKIKNIHKYAYSKK